MSRHLNLSLIQKHKERRHGVSPVPSVENSGFLMSCDRGFQSLLGFLMHCNKDIRDILLITSMTLKCFVHWVISPAKNNPSPTNISENISVTTNQPNSLFLIDSTRNDNVITSVDAYPINVAAPIIPRPSERILISIDDDVLTHQLKSFL